MERVKFFSKNDMSCGYYLKMAEKLLNDYESEKIVQGINDAIELYNIVKFFENKIYFTQWTADNIKHYEEIVYSRFEIVAQFFHSITNDNFIALYNDVEIEYQDDFFELVEKFHVYKDIKEDILQKLLGQSSTVLYKVLKNKNTTDKFGETIRYYMLNDCETAEILLDKYEIKHIGNTEPLFLPKELSCTDKEAIINNYVDSESPNLNYLRLIVNIQSNKDKLILSPKTILKAKRKTEEQEKKLFHEGSGMKMVITVGFSESQKEEFIIKHEDLSVDATYSTKWIKDNLDYATLLNNFIHLFNFVDLQMRCTFVSKCSYLGVFERIFLTSKNSYNKGVVFEQFHALSLLQINGYYNELFGLGIRLEELIEWFFEEYLLIEFRADNFRLTMPSTNSTLLEKCTNIMPDMESILKQFSLFVQDGQVDFELLEVRSEHLIYKNIPSLIDKKYVYGIGDEFKTATLLLFSDQSGLGYNDKLNKSYDNFFKLLCNEVVNLNDYPLYCVTKINWLIEHDYLSINAEKHINVSNKLLVTILNDLYCNEVISYWHYPESGRKIIDELEKKNIIEFESSLFSRPEQDYINYLLNRSQFNNGLDLRNRYTHTQPSSDDDDKMHNENYMIFLRLFILTVIKLNDDFCIADELHILQNSRYHQDLS